MKATRETSKIYAGTERIAYLLSEPLQDRTYPFIDSLTGVLRFERPRLVMTWGKNGEHLSVCDMRCEVRDFTPICAEDETKIRLAISEAGT